MLCGQHTCKPCTVDSNTRHQLLMCKQQLLPLNPYAHLYGPALSMATQTHGGMAPEAMSSAAVTPKFHDTPCSRSSSSKEGQRWRQYRGLGLQPGLNMHNQQKRREHIACMSNVLHTA